MSTRPRISFDSRGWCNACQWAEAKKVIDWSVRQEELRTLLDKHRRRDGQCDVLVPVSGGKDGSYVAYNLKHKYGMNPLAVTINPALPLPLGEENLQAFIRSGYNHIAVSPDCEAMRVLNKTGFIEMGFPYYGWLTSILATVLQVAVKFGLHLVFYGEDGEVEYGGTTATHKNPIFSMDYMRKIYLEGGYEQTMRNSGLSDKQLSFFRFPDESGEIKSTIDITHWSYFESWDPYRNYLVAKEHCGLSEAESSNAGTFTNFSQNDQMLYSLHTYMMYLKFGFGRANQAVNLVRLYDGQFPEQFIPNYLEHFRMTKVEFDAVIDRWANKALFEKREGLWKPLFTVV